MLRVTTLLCAFALATPALADEGHMPEAMKVGPAHAGFAKMAGTWDVAQTMFMPDGKTMQSKGKQVVRLVLGGLGVAFDYEGEMGGQKMVGHGFQTWIPGKSKYEGFWFDNFSINGGSHGWATYDEKTKTMDEHMTGPGPDGKDMPMHMVTKVNSDDKMTMTMFMAGPDGKEMKFMEMVYTRAK